MRSGPIEEFAVTGDDGETRRALHGSPAAAAPAGAGHTRTSRGAPWRGALPWMGIAVLLVLAAVAVAPARPPEVYPWGQVADVTSRPEPAWVAEPGEGTLRTALLADGVLITVSTGGVQGISLQDGAREWSQALDRPRCTSNGQNLVCVEPGTRVLDLAPQTGLIVAERALPQVQLATREAGDLYAITGGQEPQLQRFTGTEPVWSVPVDDIELNTPVGRDLTVIAGHVLTNAVTAVLPRHNGSAAGSVVDAESGTPVGAEQGRGGATVRRLTADMWTSAGAGTAAVYVRGESEPHLTAAAGASIGYDAQWDAAQQLRTGPDGSIGVFDTGADTWLWQGGGPQWPLARVDGVLIGMQSSPALHVVGRASATGEVLWTIEDRIAQCPCLADGHTLVASLAGGSAAEGGWSLGRAELLGIDARSGEVVWRLQAQSHWTELLTDGAHLVAIDPPRVRAWDLGQ